MLQRVAVYCNDRNWRNPLAVLELKKKLYYIIAISLVLTKVAYESLLMFLVDMLVYLPVVN